MDLFPLVLVVVSTIMHASWNLLIRYAGGNTQTYLWRMQLSIALMGAVPVVLSLVTYPSLTVTAFWCLLGSGLFCGLHYLGLSRGYEIGDFTTVYPASRAIPVLLIGLGDTVRGYPPNIQGWLGMLLVAVGCFFVPLSSATDIKLRHYVKPVSLWILVTAIGTVGYSLFDKVGMETVPRGPRAAGVYCYLFQLLGFLSFTLLRLSAAKPLSPGQKSGWLVPAVAGVMCYLSYWLILCAFQIVQRASYVVAFRQLSIVIGMLLALFFLNEPGRLIRITGAIFITAGLLLLKVFGE